MATLTGELISETYDSLLKVTDNNTITGIKKRITDGFGNDIPLLLSSTDIEIDGTFILSALTDLAPASKFLSLKADNSVGFRTSSELLSDIGGASSASISGTTGRLSKFTSSGAVGNSILDEIGNVIHLTDGTSSYASFGIINPGVDNDCYIGSTINNDFIIRVNNTEALRIDTNFRLKIANIQNALYDTDKFLVSEDGVVKYRTGAEVLADIGGASAGSYVPYIGATSDVNLGAFNITATSLIKSGGVYTQFLKADGSVDNNNYLTANDLPSTLSLYATNVAAAVAGYFKLVTTIDDPDYNTIAVDVPTGEITTTNQLIASLVSPVNLINGNPGVFNVTTTGNITRLSGSGEAEFFFRIYKRDSVGVETLVGTSGNTIPVINTGYSEFFATAIWNDGVFDVTDSIVLKYYANRIAGGSNPTYQFQFGGDQPVRTIVPIPTAVIPNIFLEQLADVEDGVEANNDGIFFDSSVSLWKYKSVAEVLGYTPVSSTGTLNYIPKFSGANSLINSTIFEDAGGVAIGVPFSEAGFLFYVNGGIKANGNSTINGDLTSNKFIVPGGTSSQFLKANGSLDSNSYALASSLANYVDLTTNQTIAGTKTFSLDAVVNGVNIGRGGGSLSSNTRVGGSALQQNSTGNYNSAFGFQSLIFNLNGNYNTGIGYQSLNQNSSGSYLTALGASAGTYISSGLPNTTSSNSVYLGYDTRASANGNTNEIVIGYNAIGGGSNSATLGNTSIATTILHGNTSIGYTTNPSLYKLDVNGTGRFSGNVIISKATPLLVLNDTSGSGAQIGSFGGNLNLIDNATGTKGLVINLATGAATFTATASAPQFYISRAEQTNQGLSIQAGGGETTFNSYEGTNSVYGAYVFNSTKGTDTQERMRITSGGNVLIGTTTDSGAKLQVNGIVASSSGYRWDGSSGGARGVVTTSSSLYALSGDATTYGYGVSTNNAGGLDIMANQASQDIRFWCGTSNASPSERMRITSGGNCLIGTTTDAGYKLDVNGTGRFAGDVDFRSNGTPVWWGGSSARYGQLNWNVNEAIIAATAGNQLTFRTNGVTSSENRLVISSTGAATFTNLAGSGSRAVLADANGLLSAPVSDMSVKQNIKPIGYGLNEIVKMNPVWFDFVDDYKNFGEGRQNGNIAQEMEAIIPEAVFTTPSTGKMGINYDQLHAVYIKAIQELKAEIDLLKNK